MRRRLVDASGRPLLGLATVPAYASRQTLPPERNKRSGSSASGRVRDVQVAGRCSNCMGAGPESYQRAGLRSSYCCWATWLRSRLQGDDLSWAPWGFRWGTLFDGGSGLVRSSSAFQTASTLHRVRQFNELFRRFSGRWVRDGVRGRRVPLAWMLSGLRIQGPVEEFVMIHEDDVEDDDSEAT